MFAFPVAGWQRVALALLLTVPFLVVVLVLSPVLVAGLIATKQRRKEARALLRLLIDWSKVIAGSTQQPPPHVATTRPRSVPRVSGQ